jgi:hypothetical protein
MISTNLLILLLPLQTSGPEATSPPKPIVLKAARLFDGKSDALLRACKKITW